MLGCVGMTKVSRGQVLLIEDDSDMAEVMKLALEMEGFHVYLASEGQEALDLLSTIATPNVIFMDLRMAGMDGVEFRSIQKKDPKLSEIHLVVMSAADDMESRIPPCATVSYLRKPYSLDQVVALAKQRGNPAV